MTFYETVIEAMKIKGIKSIAELCRKASSNPEPLYPSYFSKLKSGKMKTVTWDRALQIISALGMTPNEFSEIQMRDK